MNFTCAAVASFCLMFLVQWNIATNPPRRQKFVETYWESWIFKDYPTDYCAEMKDVPATPLGSSSGANIINIAFADYTGGFNGIECNVSMVKEGIEAVHQNGGLVKLALGGALYSMSFGFTDESGADAFCDSIVSLRDEYKLDGIDLDVEDGGTNAQLQTYLIKSCRDKLGPDFLITYTLPALASNVEPWRGTLTDGGQYLDYVNVMAYDVYWTGYDFSMDIEALQALGIPKSKIVLGVMIGHHDAANEYTSLEDAVDAVDYVKSQDLAGVMTWDINRDCDQRMNYPAGQDNLYQTGLPPATFINLLSQELNSDTVK